MSNQVCEICAANEGCFLPASFERKWVWASCILCGKLGKTTHWRDYTGRDDTAKKPHWVEGD